MLLVSDTTTHNLEIMNLFIQLTHKHTQLAKYQYGQLKSALVRFLNHESGKLLPTVPAPFIAGNWDTDAVNELITFIK